VVSPVAEHPDLQGLDVAHFVLPIKEGAGGGVPFVIHPAPAPP